MTQGFLTALALIAGVALLGLYGLFRRWRPSDERALREARLALLRCEEELRYARRQGMQAEFAGALAAEMTNRLVAIQARAQLIARQPLEPIASQHVEILSDHAESTRELARKLLEISHRRRQEPRLLETGAMVREMEAGVRSTIGDGIVYTSLIAPNLPMVSASRMDLERVVMVWVTTARDAMPSGGSLQIAVEVVNEARRGSPDRPVFGTGVELTVRDSGSGFDRETLAHLFESSFTARQTHEGMGYLYVKELVDENGGRIEVTSEPGAGTVVRMRFPAAVGGGEAAIRA